MPVDAESLQNLLASLRRHSAPVIPAPPAALYRGDVIEIQGPAASGKTHLLYHILLSLLLGPVPPLPHAQIAAVVYDTDASFDIHRLRHLLLQRISRLPSSTLDPLECVRQSLLRLHLFRPASLAQLAASIANLPAYHTSHMPNQEIALLAIDSISTFYWPDRLSSEQSRSSAPEKAASLHRVLNAVQALRRSHLPLVVLANWALSSASPGCRPPYKQHLHPFPVLEDATADLGAKDPVNPNDSPFPLAYHLTLSSPSSDTHTAAPPDEALLLETRHAKHTVDRQVRCLTISPATRDIACFAFHITADDVLVQPPESFGPVL